MQSAESSGSHIPTQVRKHNRRILLHYIHRQHKAFRLSLLRCVKTLSVVG